MKGNTPRRMADVRLGKDACFDAWLYNLFIDNNLVHDLNPHIVASPEQLRFMVAGGPGSVYLPCSDALFALLCESTMPRRLQKEYNRAWRILVRLVRSLVTDRMQRRALLLFCRYRFRSAVAQHTLLPPRLIKRMTNIVLAQGLGDGDPWRQRRHALNILQREICARRACVPPSKACRRHRCRIRSKRPGPPGCLQPGPAPVPFRLYAGAGDFRSRQGPFWKRSSTVRSGRPRSWKGIWMSWPPGRGPSCICATPTGAWSSILLWCASCCACSIVSLFAVKDGIFLLCAHHG